MQATLNKEAIISELMQVWDDFGVQTPMTVTSVAQKPQINKKVAIAPPKLNVANYKKPVENQQKAGELAKSALNLAQLKAVIENYDGIPIKKGATNLVFCDGNPDARIMVIGDAPSREEDVAGKAFVGAAGQFLDKMLKSIGFSREKNVYLTYCVNWRTPANRQPTREELVIFSPFIKRHIELFAPKVLILLGDPPASAILETMDGVAKLRRRPHEFRFSEYSEPIKTYCIFSPQHLSLRPADKALAWKDLLSIREQIQDLL